jgi:hypothetical protein
MAYFRNALVALSVVAFACTAVACGDDDGAAVDAGDTIDADPNAPDADPNAPDAGGGPDADPNAPDAGPNLIDGGAGVVCGTATCTGTDVCCSEGIPPAQTCVAEGTCGGSEIECDGPEDCGNNQRCCGSGGIGNGGVSCQTGGGQCQAELCHTAADCSTNGDMCCETLLGASLCQAQCFGI